MNRERGSIVPNNDCPPPPLFNVYNPAPYASVVSGGGLVCQWQIRGWGNGLWEWDVYEVVINYVEHGCLCIKSASVQRIQIEVWDKLWWWCALPMDETSSSCTLSRSSTQVVVWGFQASGPYSICGRTRAWYALFFLLLWSRVLKKTLNEIIIKHTHTQTRPRTNAPTAPTATAIATS